MGKTGANYLGNRETVVSVFLALRGFLAHLVLRPKWG